MTDQTTNQQDQTPRPGDRVEVTAVQSYEITWDDSLDRLIGLTGVLVAINESGVRDNTQSGRLDAAPYEVRIDRDTTIEAGAVMFVAGVRRLADEAAMPDQTSDETAHLGGQANAEDCPACKGTNPPYPFLCPGTNLQQPTEARP